VGSATYPFGANFSALDLTFVCGTDLAPHLLLDSLSALLLSPSVGSGPKVTTLWPMACPMAFSFDAYYGLCLSFLQWTSRLSSIGLVFVSIFSGL